METYIFEATDGGAYGKFLVGVFGDDVWEHEARIARDGNTVMYREGWWDRNAWFFLQDLSEPGNGSIFEKVKGGDPKLDVEKKHMEVCLLFVDFLNWIREQGFDELEELPKLIVLKEKLGLGFDWRAYHP